MLNQNLSSVVSAVFFLLFSFSTASQTVDISDTKFKNTLINTLCADNDGDGFFESDADSNNDGSIQVSEALAVKGLDLRNDSITSLVGIKLFSNLQYLNCSFNRLTFLNLQGMSNLKTLHCSSNKLSSLNLQGLTNLEVLFCGINELNSLDVLGMQNLKYLYCFENELLELNVQGMSNLLEINCMRNSLTSLDVEGLPNLESLICSSNKLNSLSVQGLSNLKTLKCDFNKLYVLELTGLSNLQKLHCSSNKLTVLDVANLSNIELINCSFNQLEGLDVQNLLQLKALYCQQNQLSNLFVKNGLLDSLFVFHSNPLTYLCCNDFQINYAKSHAEQWDMDDCSINSYCTFEPGGIFYTLMGRNSVDLDADGCGANDPAYAGLVFNISNGAATGTFMADASGDYSIPLLEGTHNIVPVLENPDYFTISTNAFELSFPTAVSPFVQNFCLTPNGTHHDLEVTVLPLEPARPGFNARYQVVLKNKGNQVESGTLNWEFDGNRMDFLGASSAPDTETANSLAWEFMGLRPLESQVFEIVLRVNSPTEVPPVNIGEFLLLKGSVTGGFAEETPNDNSFLLQQLVVGSNDPNDKTCLEGAEISTEQIGDYLHYLIRFENTGTYFAENIVVSDRIDTSKFELASFQMTHSSHTCRVRVVQGNQVEFFFENINLPITEPDKHGFVAFKIKTKPTLTVGDKVVNAAAIYFDHNFPIYTNKATTKVVQRVTGIKNPDKSLLDFAIYPNPAQDMIYFKTEADLKRVEVYDALGRNVKTDVGGKKEMDITTLPDGLYWVKIYTVVGSTHVVAPKMVSFVKRS